jgi:hypothetical protein
MSNSLDTNYFKNNVVNKNEDHKRNDDLNDDLNNNLNKINKTNYIIEANDNDHNEIENFN